MNFDSFYEYLVPRIKSLVGDRVLPMLITLSLLFLFLLVGILTWGIFHQEMVANHLGSLALVGAAVGVFGTTMSIVSLLANIALDRQINWLTSVAGSQADKLDRLVERSNIGNVDAVAEENNSPKWPWGDHHTKHLGHLNDAATRFWKLYDPNDVTTAPTNEMIINWLMTEKGASAEKSRAIASILRLDGLPTGPRTFKKPKD